MGLREMHKFTAFNQQENMWVDVSAINPCDDWVKGDWAVDGDPDIKQVSG